MASRHPGIPMNIYQIAEYDVEVPVISLTSSKIMSGFNKSEIYPFKAWSSVLQTFQHQQYLTRWTEKKLWSWLPDFRTRFLQKVCFLCDLTQDCSERKLQIFFRLKSVTLAVLKTSEFILKHQLVKLTENLQSGKEAQLLLTNRRRIVCTKSPEKLNDKD